MLLQIQIDKNGYLYQAFKGILGNLSMTFKVNKCCAKLQTKTVIYTECVRYSYRPN